MFKFAVLLFVATIVTGRSHPRYHPHLDGRIVGGKDANIEDYPYQLSLRFMGSHFCGASIISSKWAVTAAHCTYRSPSNYLSIRAGSSIVDGGGQIINVKTIYQHPLFDFSSIDYDISLLELSRDLIFDNKTSPIELPGVDTSIEVGSIASITGWGHTSEYASEISKQLQMVQIPVISNEECQQDYGKDEITLRMFCAGLTEGGEDSCQGDSGGPLAINGKLFGIVSWGLGCARPHYHGVYSNIPVLRNYVTNITGI